MWRHHREEQLGELKLASLLAGLTGSRIYNSRSIGQSQSLSIDGRIILQVSQEYSKGQTRETSHNPLVATFGTTVNDPENFPVSTTPNEISPSLTLSEALCRLTPISFREINLFDF